MEEASPVRRIRARGLLGWPLLAAVLLLGAAEAAARWHPHPAWSSAAVAAAYAAWGGWIVVSCRRHGVAARRLGLRPPRERKAWRYLGLAAPLLVLSVGLISLQIAIVSWLAPELFRGYLDGAQTPAAAPSLLAGALDVLAVVILAPVVEEVAFRGAILASWSRRRGHARAVLGTAALFALLHPGDLVGTLVFGLVLAAIRLRTGTLWIPIACHALYNGVITLLSAGSGPSAAATAEQLREAWWIGAACVAAAAPVLFFALRHFARPARGLGKR
jgi:membrane protease YdiL (CAAX protease family)